MRTSALVLSALLPLTFVADAEHSFSACDQRTTTIDAAVATLYLVYTEDETWLYLESNAHAGLQQGGSPLHAPLIGGHFAHCWDRDRVTGEEIENPDFIVL